MAARPRGQSDQACLGIVLVAETLANVHIIARIQVLEAKMAYEYTTLTPG